MTKSEFAYEAGKANLFPEIFGMTLNCAFIYERIPSGCKIVGIEWRNSYQTRSEYSPYLGTHEVTFLATQPYVVLKKNRKRYIVEAQKVATYVSEKMREQFFASVKINNNVI